ncbi:Protein kinase A anchor protein, nuclear localisation signal domain [Lasallia pustulata]|uniref:Protein kinase A anchor protein, nuclear localisation signal domain n=1 Tax=Lasallia pustulata TaxID=136370 RepID=A0A1W5CRD0_9LECA|nr:Protein kinase A anchor protein, nuclear localisation signal domain [Lasallia pustulata]
MPPRPPLTHFLCLPLVTASSRSLLQTSLETFSAEAVSPTEASTVPIPEKAIRPLGTLHLTIGVMTLQTQDRIDACLNFLRGLDVHDLLRRAEEASPVAFESSSRGPIEAIDEPSIGTPNSEKVPNGRHTVAWSRSACNSSPYTEQLLRTYKKPSAFSKRSSITPSTIAGHPDRQFNPVLWTPSTFLAMPVPQPAKAPLQVGVLLCGEGVQLLDVSPVDLLGMLQPQYIRACQLPQSLADMSIEMEIHFISETGHGPHQLTGGMKCAVTHSLTTCPALSILIVGGPPPTYRPSQPIQSFLHKQVQSGSVLFSVCTGIFVALPTDLLQSKRATAPRMLLPMLRAQHPETHWEEKRWVRDGHLWSSGGVTNGLDMMAAFMRERWPERRQLVECVLEMADVGGRGQDYAGGEGVLEADMFGGSA